jgi:hypothetical protein
MSAVGETKLLLDDRRAVLDAIFQLIKWLIATLFLLNGAAALAVLSQAGIDPLVGSIIALYFVNGIMGAITGALAIVAGLLASYGRIMHTMKPLARPLFGGLVAVQLIAGLVATGGLASSVNAFVNGTKFWANASAASAQQRLRSATQSGLQKSERKPKL